jgi:hypothetical protein
MVAAKRASMGALALDAAADDQCHPARQDRRYVFEQRELRPEAEDGCVGLSDRPSEAVHAYRTGSDHPELDENLGGDHRLVATRQQRRHRPDDISVLRRLRRAEPQEDIRIEENLHG